MVIDASAALALLLADEEGRDTAELLKTVVEQNGEIHVPDLLWYEVCNGLVSAERQNRIDIDASGAALEQLGRMPIVSHSGTDQPSLDVAIDLARKHSLTYYDAVYLELALRCEARLRTYDKHLLSLRQDYPDLLV